MKYTDRYDAKLEIWARDGKVVALPRAVNLPLFSPRKFSSHEEMNVWKHEYLEAIARVGGVRWTK